jgi:diguanylate cyclase (GGDEF)-like protein/PAS domain S-box-containing protein
MKYSFPASAFRRATSGTRLGRSQESGRESQVDRADPSRDGVDRRSRAATAYQLAIIVPTALILGIDLARQPGSLQHSSIIAWTLGVALVDLMPISAAGGLYLSLSFPILLAAAMIYAPSVAGLIAFVGSVDPREIRREISLVKALFIRSQIALAVLVGSSVFHALASLRSAWIVLAPAILATIVADSAVNTGLVAAYKHLSSGISTRQALAQMHLGSPWRFLTSYLLLGLSGVVIARFYLDEGVWAALALVAPLVFARQVFVGSRELHDTASRYRSLMENIPAITYIRSIEERKIVFISPQVEEILGFPRGQWLDRPELWVEQLHPQDREHVMAAFSHSETGLTPLSDEYRLMSRDGRPVWVHHEAEVLRDENGHPQFWHGVVMDISRLKEAEEQVAFMAYHDKLTGVPNRNLLEQLLSQALHRAERQGLAVAVLFIDIDNFKLINDSLGHAAGDELLRELAVRLQTAVRDSDVVARQGGDEFLVLLTDIEMEGAPGKAVGSAEAVARRIQDLLDEPFQLDREELYVTGTIGISIFPLDATRGEDLLRNADAAMYRSKKQGPGHWLVHPPRSKDVLAELSFATRLRRAVDARQWVLHYQPIVDLDTGDVRAVEALIRWKDPQGGLIQPGEFLPLAEAMGFSGAIGDWVIQEVTKQSRIWHDRGYRFQVCFNVSPSQLQRSDVAEGILAAAETSRVDPTALGIEITEAADVDELEQAVSVLRQLRDEGLSVAMDDFGTGHSSLARLRDLPVDLLKIDRSFVRDIPQDPHSVGMVRAIIQLAKTLVLIPMAEGVETEEQRHFLASEGCPLGQGFYVRRPVPAEDLAAHLPRVALVSTKQ